MGTAQASDAQNINDSHDRNMLPPGLSLEALQGLIEALLNEIGDRSPPGQNAAGEELQKYKDDVETYGRRMLEVFRETQMKDELLWFEFTSTFRPHSIAYMSKATTVRWIDFLISGGVWVRRRRGFPRAKALVECLL